MQDTSSLFSHFPRGSVDWNCNSWHNESMDWRHFPRGSVDWNTRKENQRLMMLSLPSRKCGLKSSSKGKDGKYYKSLPSRKCGLKYYILSTPCGCKMSLPSRKCGLKYLLTIYIVGVYSRHFPRGSVDWNNNHPDEQYSLWSLPSRKCGLKLMKQGIDCRSNQVTSLAEVWIEINLRYGNGCNDFSHFPRGSVDWNAWKNEIKWYLSWSLPSRKCGLKYEWEYRNRWELCRHFPRGSVDWNCYLRGILCYLCVTSLAEVWIEITAVER